MDATRNSCLCWFVIVVVKLLLGRKKQISKGVPLGTVDPFPGVDRCSPAAAGQAECRRSWQESSWEHGGVREHEGTGLSTRVNFWFVDHSFIFFLCQCWRSGICQVLCKVLAG